MLQLKLFIVIYVERFNMSPWVGRLGDYSPRLSALDKFILSHLTSTSTST